MIGACPACGEDNQIAGPVGSEGTIYCMACGWSCCIVDLPDIDLSPVIQRIVAHALAWGVAIGIMIGASATAAIALY